ncbi:hypothetical protein SAMN05444398_1293 [Roseovarius pacificus]|uniref:Uncharacterized protein n=1 Tax=Roseovarius pacificus TaxID=337701 RepID=A0A1M7KJ27_9RHOB|nr:hypothetical protein [Roseovarius pacificus]GGO62825.1 hypothetical protein GCM10011315_42730 [Roseovarius pacificus]SHM65265.1 hypothetical protein SAMN05444398_1293 [Roseovarius pacificus]
MARRAKPRWGWEQTHDTKDFAKREARVDVDWIAEQLDCKKENKLQDIERSVLVILLQFYSKQFEEGGPSNEEIQAALDEIVKSAATLSENLERLDDWSQKLLSEGYQKLHDDGDHGFDEADFEHSAYLFLEHLSGTSNARFVLATQILKDAVSVLDLPAEKKSRGPKPKKSIKRLIEGVAFAIEDHSDRGPLDGFYFNAVDERYEGPLVEILEHILTNFAPELGITNSAIGGQIRRTIGDLSR